MSAIDDMVTAAQAVRERAYAPYSGYRVGAVVRGASGALYAGCNVENSAYPQGWCAEASAIAAMVVAGERQIIEVLVLGAGPEPCTPCGGCRQKLREFAGEDVRVHVYDPHSLRLTCTLGELMPHAFGSGNLA